MKKIYYLLALLFFFAIGLSGNAEKRYTAIGFQSGGELTPDEIVPGTPYALNNANSTDGAFFNGNAPKTASIKDANLITFELAGTDLDGVTPTYRLKLVTTGEYLLDPSTQSDNNMHFEASQAKAFVFTIKSGDIYAADAIETEATDWTSATTSEGLGAVVFTKAGVADPTQRTGIVQILVGATNEKSPSFGNDYNLNAWAIYEVEQMGPQDYLTEAINELFPEGTADLYNPGDEPGQISQELYDELINSYAAAQTLLQDDATTQEQAEAAVARCEAAIAAAKAGAVPIKEGYYYFRSMRSQSNAVYDDGVKAHWTYGKSWEMPESPTANDAKYIWKLIANTEGEGYFVQNLETKRYLGVVHTKGTHVPTTEEAEEPYLIYPQNKDCFVIESVSLIADPVLDYNGLPTCTALHCPADHDALVVWDTTSEASGWRFFNVSQEEVDAILGTIDQFKRNQELTDLVSDVKAAYKKGFTYESEATADGDFSNHGLITDVSQLWTNGAEPSEGPIENLLDGNIDNGNFFHTAWSSAGKEAAPADTYYYLAADLGEAVQDLQIKIASRINNNSVNVNDRPTLVKVYASNNDAVKPADGAATGNDEVWTYIDEAAITYDIDYVVDAATTYQNDIAIANLNLGEAYRYIRLDVTRRGTINLPSGENYWWNCSEVGLYKATYNSEKSLITAVPEEIVNRLVELLGTAEDELIDEAATQETLDALQAAYEEFLAHYPDPQIVLDLLAEAQAQLEAADDSEDALGYFKPGSKQELANTIAALQNQVKDVMTINEINEIKEALNAALAKFNASLIQPEDGTYFWIKSATTSVIDEETGEEKTALDSYMYAQGNGSRQVKWLIPENMGNRLNYVWKAIKTDEGYKFLNVGTGEYLNRVLGNGQAVTTSVEGDTCVVTLRSAKIAGAFNIVMNEGVFMNAEPQSHNVVTWGVANGADNSAFVFEEAEWLDGTYAYNVSATAGFMTLPFEIQGATNGKLYKALGVKDHALQLQEVTSVPAGEPFYYVPALDDESQPVTSEEFTLPASDYSEVVTTLEAKTVNGLVGVFEATPVVKDCGYIFNGTIVTTNAGQVIAANSAYLATEVSTEETGTINLPIDGTINSIGSISLDSTMPAQVDVYTLTGVKVRSNVNAGGATRGLSKGLYIIGGKKIFVK
ncbi:MAG: discoidin domain-containing protein [Alloprevotella sp.]